MVAGDLPKLRDEDVQNRKDLEYHLLGIHAGLGIELAGISSFLVVYRV